MLRRVVISKDRKMTVRVMQLACNQLQYWLRYRRSAVCDFWQAHLTNKLTRRASITKLFGECRQKRFYLYGLGTLVVLCHIEYTCSHVTVGGLYQQRSTNSYEGFRNPRNLHISEGHQKTSLNSVECLAYTMVSHYICS